MKLFDTPANEFEPNPMVIKHGKLDGFKCKTCSLLICKTYNTRTYYKCSCRGNTNGSGTDHRIKWNACRLYNGVIRGKAQEDYVTDLEKIRAELKG